jgi:type VI protein secretion system component VasK
VTALHLGPLHPFAQTIVLLIAFGPFVVLVAVVWWVRRRDIAEEAAEEAERSRQDAGAADPGTAA